MSKDLEFVPGLFVKPPHEKAPDFVKASVSIKIADLGAFLREKFKAGDEWINIDIKAAKSGKWYAAINTFKPKDSDRQRGEEVVSEMRASRKGGSSVVGGQPLDDDIPF